MPDSKITALTALTAADPAADMFPVVDVSDTTMAASGTTKRISINNILACSPAATLASATITGDLTVDTNVLKVDTTNNRVGINNASPAAGFSLDVAGGIRANAFFQSTDGTNTGIFGTNVLAGGVIGICSGTNVPLVFGVNSTEQMRLNSTGLGVGVVPSAGKGALQLSSGINFPATQVASSDANTLDDYIERTWTGTLKGSVSDPTVPVTATGRITKIGRKVLAEITFSNVSTVGASGAITITGLPYTNNGSVNSVGIASLNLIGTFTGSPLAFITIGGSTIELYADASNAASTQITHNAGAARYMTIQITFTV